MYDLKIKNSYGNTLDITWNPLFSVSEIDGLYPPDVALNLSNDIGTDGSVFNSAFLENRQIILSIALNNPASSGRHLLYQFFQQKKQLTLFFKNDISNLKIGCYIKNFTITIFKKKETAQITLICPKPLFDDVETIHQRLHVSQALLEFPVSFPVSGMEFSRGQASILTNMGDVESGFSGVIYADNSFSNPKIVNKTTGQFIGFDVTVNSGEKIEICTIDKQKYANKISADGISTSIVSKMTSGSQWVKMIPGGNQMEMTASSGNTFYLDVDFTAQYMGV